MVMMMMLMMLRKKEVEDFVNDIVVASVHALVAYTSTLFHIASSPTSSSSILHLNCI
jgi:hypothetical protein